jgi:DNA-binding XRE family transcriptional regulator
MTGSEEGSPAEWFERFAGRLFEARRSHGWTQHRLAHAAGITTDVLVAAERGDCGNLLLDHVFMIASVLQMDIRDLFPDDDRQGGEFQWQ